MPYKSDAQRKYFNANRKSLEAQGVDVDEWNTSSRGKKLPRKIEKTAAPGGGLIDDALKGLRQLWGNTGKVEKALAIGTPAAAATAAAAGGAFRSSKPSSPAGNLGSAAASTPAPAPAPSLKPAPMPDLAPKPKTDPGFLEQAGNVMWNDRSPAERGLMYGVPAALLAIRAITRAKRSKPRDKYKTVAASLLPKHITFGNGNPLIQSLFSKEKHAGIPYNTEDARPVTRKGRTTLGAQFKKRTIHNNVGQKEKVDHAAIQKRSNASSGYDVPSTGPESFSGSPAAGLGFMAGNLGY